MLQPLFNLIIIEPILKEKKTILTLNDEKPKSYKIIAIGESVSKVSIGDEVIIEYPRHINYDDKTIIIVSEEQIIAKVIS